MSRQRYVLIGAASLVDAAPWYGYSQESAAPPALPVPRVAQATVEEPHVASAHQLLDWGRQVTPLALVDTVRDVLPNGLALTMRNGLGEAGCWLLSEAWDGGPRRYPIVEGPSAFRQRSA